MENTTNVEMSLSTIQEAVASAVQAQTSVILAALEEMLSDEAIGQAAARYQRKIAVVNGGVL